MALTRDLFGCFDAFEQRFAGRNQRVSNKPRCRAPSRMTCTSSRRRNRKPRARNTENYEIALLSDLLGEGRAGWARHLFVLSAKADKRARIVVARRLGEIDLRAGGRANAEEPNKRDGGVGTQTMRRHSGGLWERTTRKTLLPPLLCCITSLQKTY